MPHMFSGTPTKQRNKPYHSYSSECGFIKRNTFYIRENGVKEASKLFMYTVHLAVNA